MNNDATAAGAVRFEALRRDQLTNELLERVLALYSRAFPRWPYLDPEGASADYLRWKTESPGSPFAIVLGWLDDRWRASFHDPAPLASAIRTVTSFDQSADAFFEHAAAPSSSAFSRSGAS